MTPTFVDHIRPFIAEAISKGDFVDANHVANAMKRLYPACDLQALNDAVVTEVVAARGAVAWDKVAIRASALSGEAVDRWIDVVPFVPAAPSVLASR
jgi:hypothetical protein